MVKANTKKRTKSNNVKLSPKLAEKSETDGAYLLKIVLYIILGSLWLRFATPIVLFGIPFEAFPIGVFIGLLFASHDHFQVDRKIEYVLLILMAILTAFLPTGLVI